MTLRRIPAEPGSHSTFKRKRPKPSKRSLDPVTPEVYALVFRRDGDCLLRGSKAKGFDVPCSGRHQWAHRRSVAYGGPSTPENGTRLCARHHARVDVLYRAEAHALGLWLHSYDDPSQVPVTLVDGRRVLLNDAGGYEEIT